MSALSRRAFLATFPAAIAACAADLPPPRAPGRPPPRLAYRGPRFDRPILWDTPEADRILAGLPIFPPEDPWNQDVSRCSLHPDSRAIVAAIGADQPLAFNLDMNFVLVPPDQPLVPVRILLYPGESDHGPFPIPENAPIENWPLRWNEATSSLPRPGETLEEMQREGTGDRHLLVVDPVRGRLHEFWQARRTDRGWEASQASSFDLFSAAPRPDGWTSADAAGLPIFPAVARYHELARGEVRHALRVTVPRSRRAHVHPARHHASRLDDPRLPRMGERLRLRRDFPTGGFPPHARALLEGLKRHGMLVADNGASWRLSIAPDRRIEGMETLARVRGSDFEVVIAPDPRG
jgi:hypothetical protein